MPRNRNYDDVSGAQAGPIAAAAVAYRPDVLTDWDGDADPGNLKGALDQLAERVDDNEILVGAALQNVVEDATPQLGGDLDVNGQSILSVANGNILIAPHGTGIIVLDGQHWPKAATGANTDWLLHTAGGNAYWGNFSELNVPAGGTDAAADWLCIYDVSGTVHAKVQVDDLVASSAPKAHTHDGDTLQLDRVNSNIGAFPFDTTGTVTFNQNVAAPNFQLAATGEILDTNGNELIGFVQTASAVNEITITNAATGNAPEISVTGGDANIDLKLDAKGAGEILLDSLVTFSGNARLTGGAYTSFRATNQRIWSSAANILDITSGLGTGRINFRINNAVTEMTLTANSLNFDTGGVDVGLNWATAGRLSFMIGGVERAYLLSSRFTVSGGPITAEFCVVQATVATGWAGTYRFGDEVLAPASGTPSLGSFPTGFSGASFHGWHVVFDGTTKCISPLWS